MGQAKSFSLLYYFDVCLTVPKIYTILNCHINELKQFTCFMILYDALNNQFSLRKDFRQHNSYDSSSECSQSLPGCSKSEPHSEKALLKSDYNDTETQREVLSQAFIVLIVIRQNVVLQNRIR